MSAKSIKDLTDHTIRDAHDPHMRPSYDALYDYFGHRGEMETLDVIRSRLSWSPREVIDGFSYLYEMVTCTDLDNNVAAVRDHTVILNNDAIHNQGMPAVVHLSHILVRGKHAGRGLVDHLHPFPISAAREALAAAGLPPETSIVLAAEVEPPEAGNLERTARLTKFRDGGYRSVDPHRIPYVQPDFRDPDEIERSGGPKPLPLVLILMRLGKEDEDSASCGEVRHVVDCLYRMYGRGMRAEHMKAVYKSLSDYPSPEASVSLTWDWFDKASAR